jgi:hypothetical protein
VKALFLVVVACALVAPSLAYARDWRPGFALGPGQFPRGDHDKRGMPDKDNRGRLTQEERRELHRDLDRANREIYKK